MQTLPLTQNKVACVDDSDYAALSQWKWTYLSNKRSGYAVRWETRDGKRRTVYMHRQIMGDPAGRVVDHEDGDGLNNQRDNLRVCGSSHNGANKPAPARCVPFKGVYPSSPSRCMPWYAQIKAFRRTMHLGAYATQQEAARAYDRAALHFFGSFARLNFPDEREATRLLPLPRSIARRLEATQLALPFDEALPEAPIGRADWLEYKIQQDWRRARVPSPADLAAIDDLL